MTIPTPLPLEALALNRMILESGCRIYSTIYVSNLAVDIIHDVEAELDEKEQHTKLI